MRQADQAGTKATHAKERDVLQASSCLVLRLQTDQRGCATFTIAMSRLTRLNNKAVGDQLTMTADVEEGGTGQASGQKDQAVYGQG